MTYESLLTNSFCISRGRMYTLNTSTCVTSLINTVEPQPSLHSCLIFKFIQANHRPRCQFTQAHMKTREAAFPVPLLQTGQRLELLLRKNIRFSQWRVNMVCIVSSPGDFVLLYILFLSMSMWESPAC